MAVENEDLPGDEPTPKPVPETPAPKAKAKVEPEPEPKVEPEAKVELPKKHTHTERLTRIALQMGFSQADLDNHDSTTIWDEVNRINELAARRAAAKEAPKAKVEPEVDEDEQFIKELEGTDTDPKYIAFLKRQHARTKAAEAKASKVDELEARDKQRSEQSLIEAADAAFAHLAKDPKAALLIGTGASDELDPGELGWRRHIWQNAGAKEDDSPAVLKRKLIAAGGPLLAKKLGVASATVAPVVPAPPPPAPAPKKKHDVRAENGQFTEDDFAASKLPVPGNRLLNGTPELVGAAAIHSHMREVGDPRAELGFVDRDADEDLPE